MADNEEGERYPNEKEEKKTFISTCSTEFEQIARQLEFKHQS